METHQPTLAPIRGNHLDTQFLRRHFTKVVIQEIPTRRYWKGTGVWTSEIDKATTFRSCSAAMEDATHLKLKNVQLVLTRELRECEVFPLKTSIRA
jgi:hypothetical protein